MKSILSLCVLLLLPLAVSGEEVSTRVDHDGPSQGTVTLELEEMWRAGGDEGEVIFGRISDLVGHPNGEIYVLDNQLCQVEVFGPEGEHRRTLSREGEGPGEVKQPIGVVLLPDDQIGIGAGFPGKMVTLKIDGTPVDTRYPIGEPGDSNIGVMISLGTGGGVLAATGGRLVFESPTSSHANRFLAISDAAGGDYKRILEKETPLDPTGRLWDEKADYYFDGRWDLGPDGLIYVPAHREKCLVSVYDRDGNLLRSFGRDLPLRKRTEEEKASAGPIINVNGQRTDEEWDICDTDPSITRVMVNPDDATVWVLTPQGDLDPPTGILEAWDVYGPDGEYLRQVLVPLGNEIQEGNCFLVGDGRLVVVRGTGVSRVEDPDAELDDEEMEPLEVICYRISDG